MTKKEPTEKQIAARKKLGEAAKARAAAKRAEKEALEALQTETVSEVTLPDVPTEEEPVPAPAPTQQPAGMVLTNEQFEMLLNRFSAMPKDEPKQIAGVGIIERFPIDSKFYPNPVEELYNIPKLRRFSMRENFVIDYRVSPTKYETKQGQWYMEPRFELTLKKKQFDAETGDEVVRFDKHGKPFHPRIVLGRASFFVDPPADMIEAELAGLEDAGLSDDELRDRMQFWRYAMWIEERLIPKLPEKVTNAMKEEVIGGKAYEIEEYSMPI